MNIVCYNSNKRFYTVPELCTFLPKGKTAFIGSIGSYVDVEIVVKN